MAVKKNNDQSSILPSTNARAQELKHVQSLESQLLGSMISSEKTWQKVYEIVATEDLTLKKHREIYNTIRAVALESMSFDVVSIIEHLKNNGQLEQVGGADYLVQITADNPSGAHAENYAHYIKNASQLRALARLGEKISHSAHYPEGKDADAVKRAAEEELFSMSEFGDSHGGVSHISATEPEIRDTITRSIEDPKSLHGLSTGFEPLDTMLYGLHPGDLLVLAARPGNGKTALALNIAQTVALNNNPVLFFSMEMTCKQLAMRMLSSMAEVSQTRIRNGALKNERELQKVEAVLDRTRGEAFPLYIDDGSSLNPLQVITQARLTNRIKPLKLIVIDYIQLMTTEGKESNRVSEIAIITRSLKQLAKQLRVPVLALSQLSRDVEKRQAPGKIEDIRLSDLRDSGTIEQDADVVVIIQHEKQKDVKSTHVPCRLNILKHRNGPTGTINLEFNKELATFSYLESVDTNQSNPTDRYDPNDEQDTAYPPLADRDSSSII